MHRMQCVELDTSIPVPASQLSTSSYGISGGISNTGWNAFASQETDGTRMGLGWGHKLSHPRLSNSRS